MVLDTSAVVEGSGFLDGDGEASVLCCPVEELRCRLACDIVIVCLYVIVAGAIIHDGIWWACPVVAGCGDGEEDIFSEGGCRVIDGCGGYGKSSLGSDSDGVGASILDTNAVVEVLVAFRLKEDGKGKTFSVVEWS